MSIEEIKYEAAKRRIRLQTVDQADQDKERSKQEKRFKLKTLLEIGELVEDKNVTNLIIYIDKLHNVIKNYQIVIDQAIHKNENVC